VDRLPWPHGAFGSVLELGAGLPAEVPPNFPVPAFVEDEHEHSIGSTVPVHVVLTDELIELTIKSHEPTIGDVKDKLEERYGISTFRQVVLVAGQVLHDGDFVSAHLTSESTALRLVVKAGLSISVSFRDGVGNGLLYVMDVEGNGTAKQGHVALLVEQVLQIPISVQDLRLGDLPWNNASEELKGVPPLNVLPLTLMTKPHAVVDAALVLAPEYNWKRVLRYAFNASTPISTMRSDVIRWLMTFEDFNDTSYAETNETVWRMFFLGQLIDEHDDNRSLGDLGLRPHTGTVPLDLDDYSPAMHIFIARRKVSELVLNMSVKTPFSHDTISITGLTSSDRAIIAAVLVSQRLLSHYSDADGPPPTLTFRGKVLEHDRTLSDYGVYDGCVLHMAMAVNAGGVMGVGKQVAINEDDSDDDDDDDE